MEFIDHVILFDFVFEIMHFVFTFFIFLFIL